MGTITCKAYSGTTKTELPGTYTFIGSVTGGVWPGSGNTVSNTGSVPVGITPVTVFPSNVNGVFQGWSIRKGDPGTHSKGILTVPAGDSCHARAYYAIPNPDPCQADREKYLNCMNPQGGEPPPPPGGCDGLLATLHACETEYGEPLT
jgi:hypothetical protein